MTGYKRARPNWGGEPFHEHSEAFMKALKDALPPGDYSPEACRQALIAQRSTSDPAEAEKYKKIAMEKKRLLDERKRLYIQKYNGVILR